MMKGPNKHSKRTNMDMNILYFKEQFDGDEIDK